MTKQAQLGSVTITLDLPDEQTETITVIFDDGEISFMEENSSRVAGFDFRAWPFLKKIIDENYEVMKAKQNAAT